MKAFLSYLFIQFKMDLRNKGTLLTYYFTPLVFFFIMGAVFSSTTPLLKETLSASMTIFAVSMGTIMGAPLPLVQMKESGTMRAFKVNGIPGAATLAVSALSAFIHLFIVSIIIYVVSPIAFHSVIPVSPIRYFLIVAIFLFTSVGIGMFIGVYSNGQSFATMFSMIVFMPSIILSGIMFEASMLPKVLVYVGRIFPATYALQSFYGFAYGMETSINAGSSLLIIAMIGVIMFLLSYLRLNIVSKSEKM